MTKRLQKCNDQFRIGRMEGWKSGILRHNRSTIDVICCTKKLLGFGLFRLPSSWRVWPAIFPHSPHPKQHLRSEAHPRPRRLLQQYPLFRRGQIQHRSNLLRPCPALPRPCPHRRRHTSQPSSPLNVLFPSQPVTTRNVAISSCQKIAPDLIAA